MNSKICYRHAKMKRDIALCFGAVLELSYFERIPSFQFSPHGDLKSLQVVIAVNFGAYMAVAHLSSALSAKLRQAGVELRDKSGELCDPSGCVPRNLATHELPEVRAALSDVARNLLHGFA